MENLKIYFVSICLLILYGISIQFLVAQESLKKLPDYQVSMFINDQKSLSIEQILQAEFQQKFHLLKPSDLTLHPNFKETWFKIELQIPDNEQYVLNLDYAAVEEINFYGLSSQNRILNHYQTGLNFPFSQRPINYNQYVFPIKPAIKTIYLKFNSRYFSSFALVINDLRNAIQANERRDLFQGIYLGLVILMLFYNLFIFIIIKEKIFFYFILDVLGTGMLAFMLNGYTFQFLWPQYPIFNQYIQAMGLLFLIPSILFTTQFLETSRYIPQWHRGFQVLIVLMLIGILLDFMPFRDLLIIKFRFLAFFSAFYTFVVAWVMYFKKAPFAQYFLFERMLYLSGLMIVTAATFGFLPYNYYTRNALNFGSVVDMILLSLIIAVKINSYVKEKEKAQKQAFLLLEENAKIMQNHNICLENTVLERTQDLHEKNEEILQQNQSLQEIQKDLICKQEELENTNRFLRSSEKVLRKAFLRLEETKTLLQEKNMEVLSQNEELEAQREILHAQNEILNNSLLKLKDTQLQLIQTEKMATLGQITAGIAHEINNPINYINSGIMGLKKVINVIEKVLFEYNQITEENAHEQLQKIKDLKEDLNYDLMIEGALKVFGNIEVGSQKIVEMVKELRNFSRLDNSKIEATDLHEGINSTLLLLQNQFKNQIRIIRDFGDIPKVECHPGKINQVFMNLIINAMQAINMREEQEGNLDLAQKVITIKTELVKKNTQEMVMVCVEDTGLGILEEFKNKIFEPFFTTKETNKGTGLGLSISLNIIELHHGLLEVESEFGKGTRFCLYLPVKHKNNL